MTCRGLFTSWFWDFMDAIQQNPSLIGTPYKNCVPCGTLVLTISGHFLPVMPYSGIHHPLAPIVEHVCVSVLDSPAWNSVY